MAVFHSVHRPQDISKHVEKMLTSAIEEVVKTAQTAARTMQREQLERFNDLQGFDMVYALSQDTINKQFELLYAENILPDSWQAEVETPWRGDNGDMQMSTVHRIEATLGLPTVSLINPEPSSRKVTLVIPVTKGSYRTVTRVRLAGDDAVHENVVEQPLCRWELRLTSNLNLTALSRVLISQGKTIPKRVREQLSEFNEEMFELSYLFVNLESADLLDAFTFAPTSAGGAQSGTPEDRNAVRAMVEVWIRRLRGSDNPFILGYSVREKKAQVAEATWNPTGVTYSTFSVPEQPALSSLNYLLVTSGRKVPGQGFGLFRHNWVDAANVQGTFVISEGLVMTFLLPQLASVLKASANTYTTQQEDGLTVATLALPNELNGTLTVHLRAVPGTARMRANFSSSFRKKLYKWIGLGPLGGDVHVATATGSATWQNTFTFGMDDSNGVCVTAKATEPQTSYQLNRTTAGDVLSVLEVQSMLPKFFPLMGVGGLGLWGISKLLVSGDVSVTVSNHANLALEGFRRQVLLPAAGKLFFKDPVFKPDGALAFATTVRN